MWQDFAKDILKQLNIELSPEQALPFFADDWVKVVGGGEGSGKSFLGGLYAIVRGIYFSMEGGFADNTLVWVIGDDYVDARREFDYVWDFLLELGALDKANSTWSSHQDQPVIARVLPSIAGNVRFETVSAHDPTKVGREQPRVIIGAEASRWEGEAWRRSYDRLLRLYPNSCGFFSGSFESSIGWFAEVFTQGQGPNEVNIRSYPMPSWANRVIYPGGYDDPALVLARASSSEARFLERFAGIPSPPTDSVTPEFRNTLHVSEAAEYNPAYPVFITIDPGSKVYSVLFLQFINAEIHAVDEVYVNQWTHEQVMQASKLKPAWKSVAQQGHTIDIAGSYKSPEGFGTSVDAWQRDTGLRFSFRKWFVRDQVEKIRSVLSVNPITGKPYLSIHPRCTGFISELGGGTSPIEGVGRWRMRGDKPEAANNHACNAFAYNLLNRFGAGNVREDDASREPVSYLTESPKSYASWLGTE